MVTPTAPALKPKQTGKVVTNPVEAAQTVGDMVPKPTVTPTRLQLPKIDVPTGPSTAPKTATIPLSATREGPAATRERAPGVGEGKRLPGVSGRLKGLLSGRSPYIQRARTRAAQTANRRGLLNTSIAAGAGEAAAIDAALPIATADAGIAQAERGMRSTEFQQYRQIRSNQLMQQRQQRVDQLMQTQRLDHDAAQRVAERDFQLGMQQLEFEHQLLMQTGAFGHEAQQNALGREAARLMQEAGFGHDQAMAEAQRTFQGQQAELDRLTQKYIQERGIGADEARQQAQNDFAARQAELDREAQRIAQETGISFEEAQAQANRELKQQIAVQTAVQSAQDLYQTSLDRLALNTELPKEERDRLEEHYAFLRDQAIDAIEASYGVNLDWAQSTRPPAEEAAAA